MNITEKNAIKYALRNPEHGDWCEIIIDDWEGQDGFDMTIRYGMNTWSTGWGAPGTGGFRDFLPSIDKHYLFKNLTNKEDEAKDWKEILKSHLERCKTDGWFDEYPKEEYQTAKEDLDSAIDNESVQDAQGYLYGESEAEFWKDPHDWPYLMVVEYALQHFYERFWFDFCDHIKTKALKN